MAKLKVLMAAFSHTRKVASCYTVTVHRSREFGWVASGLAAWTRLFPPDRPGPTRPRPPLKALVSENEVGQETTGFKAVAVSAIAIRTSGCFVMAL
jgi:hypothetical protein